MTQFILRLNGGGLLCCVFAGGLLRIEGMLWVFTEVIGLAGRLFFLALSREAEGVRNFSGIRVTHQRAVVYENVGAVCAGCIL